MARRLFTALSILSLVLCIGATFLFVRSSDQYYYGAFTLSRTCGFQAVADRGLFVIGSHHGLDLATTQTGWFPEPGRFKFWSRSNVGMMYAYNGSPAERHGSLGWLRIWHRSGPYFWDLSAPAWLISFITCALPLAYLFFWWRHRRRDRHGRCPACGYNLTGNTSGVCPECGTPTTAGAKA